MNKEQLMEQINLMAEDLRVSVAAIEARPQITKNHYGEYMGLLKAARDKKEAQFIGIACIKAGANKEGVISAVNLMF